MRNHNEKTRDMARSVLPSTARKRARDARAQVRSRERARLRRELHALRGLADPDDFDGDLAWEARRDLQEMVEDRRSADKVGPLLSWAERKVERDPVLAAASPPDRVAHFRNLLPPGLIGEHAISHLRWVLGDRDPRWVDSRCRTAEPGRMPDCEIVEAIVAAGRHGDLNGRIRSGISRVESHTTHLPAERVIDDEHPAPGALLPRRTVTEHRRRRIRFLAGAHDVEAFVNGAGWDVLQITRAFHAEIARPRGTQ